MRMISFLIALSFCAAAQTTPTAAQTTAAPDARALLKETADALLQHKFYQLDQRAAVDMQGINPIRMEMTVKMAVSHPGKLRIESGGQLGSALIVSDGENTWMYIAGLKQYTKTASASAPEYLLKSLMPGMTDVVDKLKAKDPYTEAKVTGEEPVEVDGQKFDCYVVEAKLAKITLPGAVDMTDTIQKAWIEKASKLTLKLTVTATMTGPGMKAPVQMNQAVTVTAMKVDAPVPDSMFTFAPPEGVKEVPDFKSAKIQADPTGHIAADFKLKAVDGKEYSLQDLRGKIVLLDFWATWCSPCRRELPMMEKLHREFNTSGLVVLGMDAGENAETVAKFLQTTKLSYPVLLGVDGELAHTYDVNAFPTVILIDRQGQIALFRVGAGSEAALREQLAQLGLASTSGKFHE